MANLPDHFLRVAKCGRAVGLKGEMALWPVSNIEDRYQKGFSFLTEDARELEIEKIRVNKDHFVVKFTISSNRNEAEALVNLDLYAEPLGSDVLDEGEFFVHDCMNKDIVDSDGIVRGKVTNFIPNAASDLLETDRGDLIPFRFITAVDDQVHVDVPEGLFGVNDKEDKD